MASIKLTNSVQLSIDSVDGAKGIKTSNLLKSQDNAGTWTATVDCIVIFESTSYDGNMSHGFYTFYVDNVTLANSNVKFFSMLVRKSSVVKVTNYISNTTNTCNIKAYGLK